jgi:hypothetical protein
MSVRIWPRSLSTALCISGYCSLTASRPPVVARGAVHLPEARGGGGLQIELGVAGDASRAEFGRHAPAHEGPAHGRGVGLQLGELLGELGRKQVGDCGHHLGHLHQRPLELAERLLDQAGVAGVRVVAGEQAVGPVADAGAREAGAHAHRSLQPAREAVAFPILGHQPSCSNSSI